jgi:hypothetical protein
MLGAVFTIRYGFKDFQNHMGISSNVTLKGMIKRSMRKYPRIANAVRTISIAGSIYFILMSLIPGSSLPLQKPIKVSVLNLYLSDHAVLSSSLGDGTTTSLIRIHRLISSG